MTKWTYDGWVHEQAAHIVRDMHLDANAAIYDKAVYVIPSSGAEPGKLVLAHEKPDGATDVLSFHGHGTRIGGIPYSGMFNALWNACRRMPICPTA